MKSYSTISGKPTYFGKPGANVRYVEYEMQQEERLRQKYERKIKTPKEKKIPVTDKDIEEWAELCYTMCREVENEREWEDLDK